MGCSSSVVRRLRLFFFGLRLAPDPGPRFCSPGLPVDGGDVLLGSPWPCPVPGVEVLRPSPRGEGLFVSDIGGGVERLPGAGLAPSGLVFCLLFTAPGGGGIGLPERDFGDPGGGGIFFPEAETGPFCFLDLSSSLLLASTFSVFSTGGSAIAV